MKQCIVTLSLLSFFLFSMPARAQQERPARPLAEPQQHRAASLLGPAIDAATVRRALSPAARRRLAPGFERVVAGEETGLASAAEQARSLRRTAGYARPAGVSLMPRAQQPEVLYQALVYTQRPQALRAVGAPVHARFDGFVTTRLTPGQMSALAQERSVEYITPGATSYPTSVASLPLTGADLLHEGYINDVSFQGEGALVCVIDSGLDFTHEDFLDEDGRSRVRYLWDQTLEAETDLEAPSDFDYGVEYTQEQLTQAARDTAGASVRTEDRVGHGTHVAGIAAGDGSAFNGIYKGMAPEAGLLIVKAGDEAFSETNIVNGLSYCNERAAGIGQPLVINLSLGGQAGPHDGTSAEEQVIDNLNALPGRAVAVAAGNDGGQRIHVGRTIPVGGRYEVQFEVPAGYTPAEGASNDFFLFDGWFGSNPLADGEGVTVTVTSPPLNDTTDVRSVATLDTLGSTNAPVDTAGVIFLANESFRNVQTGSPLGGGDLNTVVQVFDGDSLNTPVPGTWTLTIENNDSQRLRFDGWLYATSPSLSPTPASPGVTLPQGDVQQTVAVPGTAESAITTGSFTSRKFWPTNDGRTFGLASLRTGQIATSSGRGPTRDGRPKPTLSAPGEFVAASKSKDDGVDPRDSNDPGAPSVVEGGRHTIKSGTSMASPHVAGALALLFAEMPEQRGANMKDLLERTSTEDTFTDNPPGGLQQENVFGAGKLDVLRAMIAAKGGSGGRRDRYSYALDPEDPINEGTPGGRLTLTDEAAFGLQFTPRESGLLASFEIETAFQAPGAPGVSGSGDLLYALYDDEGGLPGEALTDTLRKPLDEIPPSTPVRISMIETAPEAIAPQRLRVEAGSNYHVVFFTEQPGDTLQVSFSSERTADRPRSALLSGGAWQETDDALGQVAAFEVSPIVVRSQGVQELPVELAEFNVVRDGKTAVLSWKTLEETNNDRFDVLQKVDGAFEKVGAVASSTPEGTTSEPQSYTFHIDELAPGTHTFQLRQEDIDGTSSLSEMRTVQIGVEGTHEWSETYPNPFHRAARFTLSLAKAQPVQITVYDALGRQVQTLHDGPLPGLKQHTFTLEAAHLSSGLYFVRVNGENFADTQPVTLVR